MSERRAEVGLAGLQKLDMSNTNFNIGGQQPNEDPWWDGQDDPSRPAARPENPFANPAQLLKKILGQGK